MYSFVLISLLSSSSIQKSYWNSNVKYDWFQVYFAYKLGEFKGRQIIDSSSEAAYSIFPGH